MGLDQEAVARRGVVDGVEELALDRGRELDVVDASATATDEVVVVAGELLGQLVARDVVDRRQPADRAALLEHGEVAIEG